MNLKFGFLRVGVILAFAIAICWSSQAAQPSSTDSGRLVVKDRPRLEVRYFYGSRSMAKFTISNREVATISQLRQDNTF